MAAYSWSLLTTDEVTRIRRHCWATPSLPDISIIYSLMIINLKYKNFGLHLGFSHFETMKNRKEHESTYYQIPIVSNIARLNSKSFNGIHWIH
jgi:hypothetical protein